MKNTTLSINNPSEYQRTTNQECISRKYFVVKSNKEKYLWAAPEIFTCRCISHAIKQMVSMWFIQTCCITNFGIMKFLRSYNESFRELLFWFWVTKIFIFKLCFLIYSCSKCHRSGWTTSNDIIAGNGRGRFIIQSHFTCQ